MLPIVIASMGRCGSTLIWFVLGSKEYYSHNLPSNCLFAIFEKDSIVQYGQGKIDKLEDNFIYKTHSLPHINENCLAVYLFANPMNVVISAHLQSFIKQHYFHFGGLYEERQNYHLKDTLKLEENFDAWYQKQTFPLITLRYETLYKNIPLLEDFLERKLPFPKETIRKTNYLDHIYKNDLEQTYKSLYTKILHAEDAKIW
jgi:hypothetical protein